MQRHNARLTDEQWFSLIAGMQAGLYCKDSNAPYSSVEVHQTTKVTDTAGDKAYLMITGGNYEVDVNRVDESGQLVPGEKAIVPEIYEYDASAGILSDVTFKVYAVADHNVKELTVYFPLPSYTIGGGSTTPATGIRAIKITAPEEFDIREGEFGDKTSKPRYGGTAIVHIESSTGEGMSGQIELCEVTVGPLIQWYIWGHERIYTMPDPYVYYRDPNNVYKTNKGGLKSGSRGGYYGWGWFAHADTPEPTANYYYTHDLLESTTTASSAQAKDTYSDESFYDDGSWKIESDDYKDAISKNGFIEVSADITSDKAQRVQLVYGSPDGSFSYTPVSVVLAEGLNKINIKIPLYNTESEYTGECVLRVIEDKGLSTADSSAVNLQGIAIITVQTTSAAPKIPFEPLGKDTFDIEDSMDVYTDIPSNPVVEDGDDITFVDNMDVEMEIPTQPEQSGEDSVEFGDIMELDVYMPEEEPGDDDSDDTITFSDTVEINV